MLRNVRGAVKKELERSAKEINGFQKRLAPHERGDLINSIDYTFGMKAKVGKRYTLGDPDLSVVIHAGDDKAFYAKWLEFGKSQSWTVAGQFEGATHPGFAAQPFFFPGYRMGAKRARSRIKSTIRRTIHKSIGKR